jgi:CheY-like chemotaxis protein
MKHILIVDDQPENLQMLDLILISEGHKVTSAHNGKKAFELISQFTFDLIISDLEMPNGNGLWLLEQIQNYNLRVIILSGNVNVSEVELIEAGAKAFLAKPYLPQNLLCVINRLLS